MTIEKDEVPWIAALLEDARSTAKPRKHRHVYDQIISYEPLGFGCACGLVQDLDAVRRAKSAIRAGKDAERAVAKAYPGGKRVGQYGGPDDVVVGELFVIQSKAGGWFSQRVWDELSKLPRAGGRIPTLVVSERPGPGHRTRRYVVRMLEDDIALHGEKP